MWADRPFYAHYAGGGAASRRVQELRAELQAARRQALEQSAGQDGQALPFSNAMFDHACRYGHVYRALVGSGVVVVVMTQIRRVLSDLVEEELPAIREAKVSRELAGTSSWVRS